MVAELDRKHGRWRERGESRTGGSDTETNREGWGVWPYWEGNDESGISPVDKPAAQFGSFIHLGYPFVLSFIWDIHSAE